MERDERGRKNQTSRAKLCERHRQAMEPGINRTKGSVDQRDSQTQIKTYCKTLPI